MNIVFIGVGSMGKAMIPRLLDAGHHVSAWNRTPAALDDQPLVTRLDHPAQAFEQDVVITMLADDAAVEDTLIGPGVLASAPRGAIHMVMSTLSPAMLERLHALHAQAGLSLVAAPVFGIPAVAARGELNILVAGADADILALQPVLDVLGKKTWRMGEHPVQACVAKIAGNLMITQAIQALAEASVLTERHGLPAATFIDLVTQTMFACPSYQRYGKNIATDNYEPGFKLTLGLKDVNLALDAARATNTPLPAANVVRASMQAAVDAGHGDRDWSILATSTMRAALPR